MLEKMAGEALPNGIVENPLAESNPPVGKKKRNLPGTPGKLLSMRSSWLLQSPLLLSPLLL